MKQIPPCRPLTRPRRDCGGLSSSAVTHPTNQPNQHACRYSPDPHWPSLSPDVVKWFNYDVLLPAGVECPYIIDSSSTPNGTHLPRIVLSRAERAPISTVTADQQAAAEPESVVHAGSSRGQNGDTKTLPSKGNRSSLPEPMHTGSNSWTQASLFRSRVSFLWRRPCLTEFR